MTWLQAPSLPANHEFREGQLEFTLARNVARARNVRTGARTSRTRPERFRRVRKRMPGARLLRGDGRANTGLPSQNSIAMHHKRPDPGGQIGPTAIPPSKEQWRRSDVLQGKRLAERQIRTPTRPAAGWASGRFVR